MPYLYKSQYLQIYKPSLTWVPKLPMIPQKGLRKGRFIVINMFPNSLCSHVALDHENAQTNEQMV